MELSSDVSKRIKSRLKELIRSNQLSNRDEIFRCLEALGEYDVIRTFNRDIKNETKHNKSSSLKTSSFFENYGVNVFLDVHI